MDQKHRDILRSNRIHLVMNLKPSELYDRLIEGGIFSQDMIDEIKSSGTRRDQTRQLLCDLETRGRRAFPCFIQCLRDTGQQDLAGLLLGGEPASPPPIRPLVQPPVRPLAPLTPAVRPVLQPLPVSSPFDDSHAKDIAPLCPRQRPSTTPSPSPEGEYTRPRRTRKDNTQSYKMDASPCGHCLIINNVKFEPNTDLKNRKGSDIDCDKLEKRFKSLNFIVTVKTNLKYKQIKHHLAELSKKDHSLFDCCVVIILSHGTEVSHNRFPGAVHGVDGPAVPVQVITNNLNGQHCPTLQGKPKLFFIQACGGGETDTGFEVSPDEVTPGVGGAGDEMDAMPMSSSSDSLSTSDELDARATLPTPSDILVSYSTSPGFVSWRDPLSGSWYVEILDRILGEHAVTDDLVTMLMMVNNEVSQNSAKGLYKQMPGNFNFLRKFLYFQTQSQRQTSA